MKLAPSQAEQLQKSPSRLDTHQQRQFVSLPQSFVFTPIFSILSLCLSILTLRSGLIKWLTNTWNNSFHISTNSLSFLSNLYILPWLVKIFIFMVFKFLENALNPCIFTHGPLPSEKPPPNFCHYSLPRQKEIIISPPGSAFSKICFPDSRRKL